MLPPCFLVDVILYCLITYIVTCFQVKHTVLDHFLTDTMVKESVFDHFDTSFVLMYTYTPLPGHVPVTSLPVFHAHSDPTIY